MDYSPRVSSVHGISQARILGWPCPHPGHLPSPGIEPVSFMSLALAGGFYPLSMCEIFVSPIMMNLFFLSEKKTKAKTKMLSSHTEAKEIQNIFLGIVNKKTIYKSETKSSC